MSNVKGLLDKIFLLSQNVPVKSSDISKFPFKKQVFHLQILTKNPSALNIQKKKKNLKIVLQNPFTETPNQNNKIEGKQNKTLTTLLISSSSDACITN